MRICIVTDVSLLFNPRAVKEADALAEAGHDVRVVTISKAAANLEGETKLLSGRSWRYEAVNCARDRQGGYSRWLISGLRSASYRQLSKLSLKWGFAESAFCRYQPELLRAVMNEPADMYIAHNLPNLAAAAKAARMNGALLGFDIEDYHLDEDTPGKSDPQLRRIKEFLMRKYVPQCAHLSAPSNCLAETIEQELNVSRPVVLYNVFPLSYRSGVAPPKDRINRADGDSSFTAYWFSHAIGLDRGLQDFIRALPKLNRTVDVHLRGRINSQVRNDLTNLADSIGVGSQLFFLDLIHAEDLVKDAAQFDFGLALEQPINQNRLFAATNKIFVYLLAGIVPVATDTPGQREVVKHFDKSAVLYSPGDIDGLVRGVNEFLDHPERLLESKARVWELAGTRFCWDIEKQKLLDAIRKLEESRAGRAPGAVS